MSRTVVVTGANRGLGLEFAKAYARRGDRVLATVRDHAKAGDLSKALQGKDSQILSLDASSQESIDAFASALSGQPVDILVNNAGLMGEDRSVGTLSAGDFERVFRVNTFAPALLTQALLPNLKQGKRKLVLNISSQLGSISGVTPGFSYAYNSSKAALNMITAQMSKDLSSDGITLLSFCPGWNKTDMGGPNAPLDPADSVAKLIQTAENLGVSESGSYLRYDGTRLGW